LKEQPIPEKNTLKNRFANVGIYIPNLKNNLKFFLNPESTPLAS